MWSKTASILTFSWLGLARLFSADSDSIQHNAGSVTTESRALHRRVAATVGERSGKSRSQETATLGASLRRSQELVNTGSTQEGKRLAEEVFTRAKADLEVTDDPSVNYYIMGVASLILEQAKAATGSLERAVELNPTWAPARIALAKAYFEAGEPDRGLDCLRRSRVDFPANPAIKRALAEALAGAQRYDEAVRLFEELAEENPEDERLSNWLLRLYKTTGAVEKADAGFQRLLAKGEIERIDYLLQLSDIHRELGNLREMGALLQEARRENGDHPALAERFRYYYEAFADKAVKDGQSARAIIYLRRALEFAPEDPAILYRIARFHAENDEHAKAMECYQAALKTNPTNPQFYMDFGETLFAVDRTDVAVSMFERLVEEARKRGNQDEVRRFEQAHADFLHRLEARPDRPATSEIK